jgi:hypothetical protein
MLTEFHEVDWLKFTTTGMTRVWGRDLAICKRIAHGRVGATWAEKVTAPANLFPDKYRAQAHHGLFRLACRFKLIFLLET